MPLDEQKLQKINEWFKSKAIDWVCKSCGHNEWTASDIVVAPKFEKGIVLGGETVPMLQLICRHCYTSFHLRYPYSSAVRQAQCCQHAGDSTRRGGQSQVTHP